VDGLPADQYDHGHFPFIDPRMEEPPMALSTQQRNTLYQSNAPVIGAEEAALLLDQFPANEGAELVTNDHLSLAIARLENRMYVAMVGLTTIAVGIVLAVGR